MPVENVLIKFAHRSVFAPLLSGMCPSIEGTRPPNESRFVVPDQDVHPATRQRRIVNPNVYR